jgi:translation initiation factor IF-2
MTTKIRIYELAKELKVDSKRIIEDLQQIGVRGSYVASSSIDQAIANQVRERHNPNYTAANAAPVRPILFKSQASKAPSHPVCPAPPVVEATETTTSATATGATAAKLIKQQPETETPKESSVHVSPLTVTQPSPTTNPPAKLSPASATTLRVVTLPIPQTKEPTPSPATEAKEKDVVTTTTTKAPEAKTASVTSVRPIHVPPSVTSTSSQPKPVNEKTSAPEAKPESAKSLGQPVIRSFTVPTPPTTATKTSPATKPPQGEAKSLHEHLREGRLEEGRSVRPSTGRVPSAGTAPTTTYIAPTRSETERVRNGRERRNFKARNETTREQEFEKDFTYRAPVAAAAARPKPVFTEFKPVTVVEGTTVKELAEKLEVKPKDVLAALLSKGIMATINQPLSEEVMRDVAREFGYEVNVRSLEEIINEQQDILALESDALDDLEPRAPVVAVMGHVDHGKTTLLDAIRNTRVAAGEAGGITQHIGAYSVEVPDPDNREKLRRIVFLDTPGHEAFTRMRARGAKGADVAVIVVAADDGVMPQTIEAIDHARAAKVPIIVAINKVDKPEANVERVKKELADIGLLCEDWGGDTVMVEISAKHRRNLDLLLEMILLTSDLLDLKAHTKRLASGVVLEARLDKGRGPVASVLVQQGTLKVGDPFIVGLHFGRVRALIDDRGRSLKEAGPSVPVEVLGLQDVPEAGDFFQVVDDAARAQELARYRQAKARTARLMNYDARRLEGLHKQMKSGQLKELLVILKADVQGSVEALREVLQKLSNDKVGIRVIRADVGAITESDVMLASASNDMSHICIIVGFNVRPAPRVAELAKRERVDIRLHSVIYKVEEEVRKALVGLLDPLTKEVELGRAEVRKVIKVPKVGNVAGCFVLDGLIKRAAKARLIRDSVVVYEGEIASLRRFKDDVSEVKAGFECGVGLDRFWDIKEGDIIECYTLEKYAAEL